MKAMAQRGVWLGCTFALMQSLGVCLTMPFMQAQRDELGCDALCYGSSQSFRSALGLVGTVVVGRLSDRVGRVPMLAVGLAGSAASLAIGIVVPSLLGMWLALVPSSLLNQNWSVMKAHFTDLFPGSDAAAETDRSGAIGRLGMAMGISMMVGSVGGSWVASDYQGAQAFGLVAVLAAGPLLLTLRAPGRGPLLATVGTPSPATEDGSWLGRLRKLASLPVLRRRGAQLLVLIRVFMVMAFWLFYSVWTPSLKERFDFGAAEHGKLMGFIGGVYAISQGVIAKPLIRACTRNRDGRADPSALLCGMMILLAVARVFALLSSDARVAVGFFALIVIALGVANTIFASSVGLLAGASESGGLFGVLEACEAAAGMLGPILGGLLAKFETDTGTQHVVISIVVALYGANAVVVALWYHKLIVPADGAAGAADNGRVKVE